MNLETARKEIRDAVLPSDGDSDADNKYQDMLAPASDALLVIEREEGLPAKVGDVIIEDFSLRDGDPLDGAKCSYTHLSEFHATVFGVPCDSCGNEGLSVATTAYHNIAHSRSITCEYCGTTLDSESF